MPPPYELTDPAGLIRAFADLAPLWVRRDLYKMLLALRNLPRAGGPGYTVLLAGDLCVAQFLRGYAALTYAIDESRRTVNVVSLTYESPNGDSAQP